MKKLFPWMVGAGLGCAAWFVYGMLVEANKLVLERRRLRVPRWPKRLAGYKIGVLADMHLRDIYTVNLASRAIEALLDEEPDMVVIPGDLVAYWKRESVEMLETVLAPLLLMNGHVLVTPGNHEYWEGDASMLEPILADLGFHFLRNQAYRKDGITWVGIDSAMARKAEPIEPMLEALSHDDPVVALWHEPDAVEQLPSGASLMIAGHSHGGQWRFPGGWVPMTTKGGRKYLEGYFPDAPTPLYVSRGLATTGPPARFGALPEVSLLILEPA